MKKYIVSFALALVACLLLGRGSVYAGNGFDKKTGFFTGDNPFIFNIGMSGYTSLTETFEQTATFSIQPNLGVFAIPVVYLIDNYADRIPRVGSQVVFISTKSFTVNGYAASYSNAIGAYQYVGGGVFYPRGDKSFSFLSSGPYVDLFSSGLGASSPVLNQVYDACLNSRSLDSSVLPYIRGNSYSSDTATFDSSLGAIRDINMKVYTNTSELATTLKFNWNTQTTKGVDITDDGYGVLYEFTLRGIFENKLWGDENIVDLSTGEKILLSPDDVTYKLEAYTGSGDFGELYTSLVSEKSIEMARQGYSLKDLDFRLYLRPIYFDGTDSFFGDESVCFFTVKDNKFTSNWVADDADGEPSSGTGDSGSIGIGSSDDKAENNIKIDKDVETLDDVEGVLNLLTNGIDVFSGLFVSFLSFLPSWVTGFLSVVFVAVGILIVYKLIRG